ncbi:diguanylate cyclase [Candidatus Saccharibacteria bacterium]|nr:MAG: diguanylate cyclase [Candidatus Saccharibacteria bacterium]
MYCLIMSVNPESTYRPHLAPEELAALGPKEDWVLLTQEVAFESIALANTYLRDRAIVADIETGEVRAELETEKNKVRFLEYKTANLEASRAQTEGRLQAIQEQLKADTPTVGILPNSAEFKKAFEALDLKNYTTVLAFIDLGHFSLFNNLGGHAFGNEAIRTTGACLGLYFRQADTIAYAGWSTKLNNSEVARLHGDEFVIALQTAKGTDKTEFIHAVQSRAHSLGEELSLYLPGAKKIPHFHVDIGAVIYDPTLTFEQNLELADTAMYVDKSAQCETLGCPDELRNRRGSRVKSTTSLPTNTEPVA